MLTLNNIVSEIRTFATNHQQINSFIYGGIPEVGSTDAVYPELYCDLGDTASEFDQQTDSYYFDFLITGKPNHANEYASTLESLSDTKLIANDIIAYFKKHNFGQAVKLDLPVTMQSVVGSNENSVCGWMFTLKVTLGQGVAYCEIPLSSIPTPPAQQYVRIVNQDGDTIASLRPPATYTVEELQAVIDTINGNTGAIIDPIV